MLPKRSPCLYDWHFASALTIKANFLEVNNVTISLILMLIIRYSSQKGRLTSRKSALGNEKHTPLFRFAINEWNALVSINMKEGRKVLDGSK